MNVPNIGQGPGSVTALPRAESGGETALVTRASTGSDVGGAQQPAKATPAVSFTRLAWFDTNGDGRIDPRSAAAGGDATLLVPSHAVALSRYSRSVSGLAALKAREAGNDVAPTTAQTRQAIDAYQRYGQPEPSTPTSVTTPAQSAPAVATVAPLTGVPLTASPVTVPVSVGASSSGAPDGTGNALSASAPAQRAVA